MSCRCRAKKRLDHDVGHEFEQPENENGMNLKCLIGMHDWVADCANCSKCGKARDVAHSWAGCKCKECDQRRDEGHDWSEDCEKCAICGNTREDRHNWSKNCERCAICGTTREHGHSFIDCRCSVCGLVKCKNSHASSEIRSLGYYSFLVEWEGHLRCYTCGWSPDDKPSKPHLSNDKRSASTRKIAIRDFFSKEEGRIIECAMSRNLDDVPIKQIVDVLVSLDRSTYTTSWGCSDRCGYSGSTGCSRPSPFSRMSGGLYCSGCGRVLFVDDFDDKKRNKVAVEIGKAVMTRGGFDLMQQVGDGFASRGCCSAHLSMAWDEIGLWRD